MDNSYTACVKQRFEQGTYYAKLKGLIPLYVFIKKHFKLALYHNP